MSVNIIAASLRCSVLSEGTKGLEQNVAGRKQRSVQGESRTPRDSSYPTRNVKASQCCQHFLNPFADSPSAGSDRRNGCAELMGSCFLRSAPAEGPGSKFRNPEPGWRQSQS